MPEENTFRIVTWLHQSWLYPKKMGWCIAILSPQGDPPKMAVERVIKDIGNILSVFAARETAKQAARELGLPFVDSAVQDEPLAELMIRKLRGGMG